MSVFPNREEAAVGYKPEPLESTYGWDGAWPQSPAEFEGLIEAYLARLVLYAFRRLRNIHDAEDVVQEVFVRAFARRPLRKRTIRVGPYLYRMTANACTDVQRKRKREPSCVSLADIGDEAVPRERGNPSEAAAAAEEARRAEELLSRLPKAQAEAIRLRVFGELQLDEIADVMGCSIHTVSSRLRYGFKKLRGIVLREWQQ